jgi:hypothetical protein
MLFPDEALAVLREARHDPDAARAYEAAPGGFVWSDELLHRVHAACAEHDSRADFYLVAYRASVTRGDPIDEFRVPWDQLRSACPDWPGFRPGRSGPRLARSLAWERRLARLGEPGTLFGSLLLAVCLIPLAVAVPLGVHAAAISLDGWPPPGRFWLGLCMQSAGVVFWEIMFRAWRWAFRHARKWAVAKGRTPRNPDVVPLAAVAVFFLQAATVLLFALLMDGGVRLRACGYVYPLYAVPALLILALRRRPRSRGEVLFVCWGWVPVLTFGIPLALPALKSWGLVSVIG